MAEIPDYSLAQSLVKSIVPASKYLGAGIAMGIGAIGAALGEGQVASQALEGMARQPEMEDSLLRTMIIGQAITESTGIYSLIVAIMLLLVV